MFRTEDIQALAAVHEQVRRDLNNKSPRKAAKLVCKELTKLCEGHSSFWENVEEAAAKASKEPNRMDEILNNVFRFIDDESDILAALGVEDAEAGPILADVHTMIELTRRAGNDQLTEKALKLLREHTRVAAQIICEHSKGRFRKSIDWIFSTRGLKAIGGATMASADSIAIVSPAVIAPHIAPILIPHLADIGKTSLILGLGMMDVNVKAIIDAWKAGKDTSR